MKEILTFLTACCVLAVANALTISLAIALLLAALMGAISYPRQTFGLALVLGLIALALKEPLACVVALTAIGLVVVGIRQLRRPSGEPELFLTDQRQD